jgi:hypothetical protein
MSNLNDKFINIFNFVNIVVISTVINLICVIYIDDSIECNTTPEILGTIINDQTTDLSFVSKSSITTISSLFILSFVMGLLYNSKYMYISWIFNVIFGISILVINIIVLTVLYDTECYFEKIEDVKILEIVYTVMTVISIIFNLMTISVFYCLKNINNSIA